MDVHWVKELKREIKHHGGALVRNATHVALYKFPGVSEQLAIRKHGDSPSAQDHARTDWQRFLRDHPQVKPLVREVAHNTHDLSAAEAMLQKHLHQELPHAVTAQMAAAVRISGYSEEVKPKLSPAMPEWWTPERKRHKAAQTAASWTPERRRRHGEAARERARERTGWKHSEETRQKMKAAWTPERKAAHAQRLRQHHPMQTAEAREKVSAFMTRSQLGKKRSPEMRVNQSEAMKRAWARRTEAQKTALVAMQEGNRAHAAKTVLARLFLERLPMLTTEERRAVVRLFG